MDWTPIVFAVGSVALIAWALVGLWISTLRKEPPLDGTKAALMQLAGDHQALDKRLTALADRVTALMQLAGDHQALDKRLTALADRVTAIELAVKALRARMEEQADGEAEAARARGGAE